MKIAVISEFSAKDKNPCILEALAPTGARVLNIGMTGAEGESELTYIHTGLIAALALATGTADFAVGGCGTGPGFMISAMQYPGVFCGLVTGPLDAWLFSRINAGNCVSLALNKGFGWAGDVELRYIFDKLFCGEAGQGYPAHRCESQRLSRARLEAAGHAAHRDWRDILPALEPGIAGPVLGHAPFMECVAEHARAGELRELVLKA
jgi:ribose 5-phosphate isomerase RpiB